MGPRGWMDGWAFMILPFAALLTGNKSAERKKDPNYGVYNLVCVCVQWFSLRTSF